MNELVRIPIAEAHRLLLRREISATQLVAATLGAIELTEPVVHAYAHVLAAEALADAAALDEELVRGDARGPLHGIPVAVKDNVFVSGAPLHAGSRSLIGTLAPYDAVVVARLRAAGAVIVGKTVTHEFALAPERGDGPEPRNPWSLDRSPGGSSAGSGIAPMVGSAFAAVGTDTAGSVRGPAAWCGATGLKPTLGRVSRHGTVPVSVSLDHVGVIARTAADCAALLAAVAEPHPAQRGQVPAAELRIGVSRDYGFGAFVEQDVAARVEEALAAFAGMGVDVVEVSAGAVASAPAVGITILLSEALAFHRPRLRRDPDGYCTANRALLAAAERIPSWGYTTAASWRPRVRDAVRKLFDDHRLDALASPTLPLAAPVADAADTDASRLSHRLPELVRCTLLANVTGQPALSIPCGFTSGGLPVGLQLLGRPFEDETLLALAAAYEGETGFAGRKPPAATR